MRPQAIALHCAFRPGGSAAPVLAALPRLAAAGALQHAGAVSVDVAIYCGGQLHEAATTEACEALLRALGGGITELTLAVPLGFAPCLDR